MKNPNPLADELLALRNTNPKEALRRVDELDETPNARSAAAVILIDCGSDIGDVSSISRGVQILQDLSEKINFDSGIAYNLANGLQLRARHSKEPITSFRGQTADDRFLARVLFGRVMSESSASIKTKSQMLTNIGNLFQETHRWVEALDYFRQAQVVLSINAVAASREMTSLMQLANLFSQKHETYQSYCNIEALKERVRHLAGVASENYDVFVEFAGPNALPEVKKFVAQALKFGKSPVVSVENTYFSFVRHNNLALSIFCSAEEFSSGRFDLLTIPSIRVDVGGDSSVPEIFAMLNVMKSDFAFARQVFYEVREQDTETPYFETTSHADTLDYAVYGVRYSALTIAQRIAFDILDKIAVAIAVYMGLPHAHKTSFKDIWGKQEKRKGFVWCKQIEDELIIGNQPLIALYNIFQDISKHESLGDGFMGAQKQFRNASTHRFSVLHDMALRGSMQSSAIDHKDLEEFEQLTLAALRLARAALFYFVDFIIFVEGRNAEQDGGLALTLDVPDHDYIRGRKD